MIDTIRFDVHPEIVYTRSFERVKLGIVSSSFRFVRRPRFRNGKILFEILTLGVSFLSVFRNKAVLKKGQRKGEARQPTDQRFVLRALNGVLGTRGVENVEKGGGRVDTKNGGARWWLMSRPVALS